MVRHRQVESRAEREFQPGMLAHAGGRQQQLLVPQQAPHRRLRHGTAGQLGLRGAVQGAAARVLAAGEQAEAGQMGRGGQVDQPIATRRQQPGVLRPGIGQDGLVAAQHHPLQPAAGQQEMRAGRGAGGQRPEHRILAAAGRGLGRACRPAGQHGEPQAGGGEIGVLRRAEDAERLAGDEAQQLQQRSRLGGAEQRRGVLGRVQRQARRAARGGGEAERRVRDEIRLGAGQ